MLNLKNILIKDSTFFGEKLEIPLSNKLNCIMGGRGSGKTTILSLINWTLKIDEDISRDSLNLIKANLGTGSIELTFHDENGYQLTVSKSFGAPPAIKDSTGAFISLEALKSKVFLDYFPAGSIERIGIDPKERLRIFDGFIGDDIESIKGKIGILVSQLKQNEFEIKATNRDLAQIKEELQNYVNLDEEVQKVKSDFSAIEADTTIKENFEQENIRQSKRTIEQDFLSRCRDSIHVVSESRKSLASTILSSISFLNQTPTFEDKSVEAFRAEASKALESIFQLNSEIELTIKDIGLKYAQSSKETKENHQKAEQQFSELKQTIAKNRDLFQRLNTLSQKETSRKIASERQEKTNNQIENLQNKRTTMLLDLDLLLSNRFDIRTKHANAINRMLGDKVKILIKNLAHNEPFQELIKSVLSKFQMRTTAVEQKLFEQSNASELAKFYKQNDFISYAKKLNTSQERISELFSAIKETNAIYDLETCVCEDSPNFFLAVEDAGKKIEVLKPTEQLSTGQRCTAVLPIIFAVTQSPLLIDQPEDNLDNKYITNSIHQIVRQMKDRRQLIFVTHNPNIPVISDSEFNAFLDYSDRTSSILSSGSIGNVKAQIVELLEGGQQAFVKRRDFYGY